MVQTKFQQRLAVGLVTILSVVSGVWAWSSGADPAVNGGITADGIGCFQCHDFNRGFGGVELIGAPHRYRAGQTYPIGVLVRDPEQAGAGFEISAETPLGHSGALIILDALRTQYADFNSDVDFVTHTDTGVSDSVDAWSAGGGAFQYNVAWQAPGMDDGPITFFAAGNAINNGTAYFGDRYYWSWAIAHFAVPGDADADTDRDLLDFAALQNCFEFDALDDSDPCFFSDLNGDDAVSAADVNEWQTAMSGPLAAFPGDYVLADAVRGGQLYDRWWTVIGADPPVGEHPLYPEIGVQTGSVTFRCKECHGWDYKGVDGRYGSGSHFTGIGGVRNTSLTPTEIFDLLRDDPESTPNGHDMTALGLSDRDLWDLAKFVREGVVDTDDFINESGDFPGNQSFGAFYYGQTCIYCHGEDGDLINFGTELEPEYVGTVANENPWELLHKLRFGHPATPMPALDLIDITDDVLIHLGTHAQTLPQ